MNQGDANRPGSFVGMAYERHEQYLRRYLMRRLHNVQDARELAQEVWTRLLRVQDPSHVHEPLAYIRRTAANVLTEFRMRQAREPVTFDSEAADQGDSNPERALPDGLVEQLGTQQQLQRILSTLPRMYRTILLMRLCDGAGYGDIGAQLGLSAATAERYFFRAMQKVRATKWE